MDDLAPPFARFTFGQSNFDCGPSGPSFRNELGAVRLTIYTGRASWQDYMSVQELEQFASALAQVAERMKELESRKPLPGYPPDPPA